jgi:hypothetical protein
MESVLESPVPFLSSMGEILISIEDHAFSLSNHGIHLDFQLHGSGNTIRSGL